MTDEFLGTVHPTPENIDAFEDLLLRLDEQGIPLEGELSGFLQHALGLLENGETVMFMATDPEPKDDTYPVAPKPRYAQPERLVKDDRFVAQVDDLDLWTGFDDEDDEVMVVVHSDNSYTVFVKEHVIEMANGAYRGNDPEVHAAIRGAVYECWVEGKV